MEIATCSLFADMPAKQ